MDLAIYAGVLASTLLSAVFLVTHSITLGLLSKEEAAAAEYDHAYIKVIRRKRHLTTIFLTLSNVATISLWWLAYAQYNNF